MDEKNEFDSYLDSLLSGNQTDDNGKPRFVTDSDMCNLRPSSSGMRIVEESYENKDDDRHVAYSKMPLYTSEDRHVLHVILKKIEESNKEDNDE